MLKSMPASLIALAICLSFSSSVVAQQKVFMIGGGTLVDSFQTKERNLTSIAEFGKSTKNIFNTLSESLGSSWVKETYFWQGELPGSFPLTQESLYTQFLPSLNKVHQGKVILYVQGHGLLKKPGETTHSIALGDGTEVNLSKLLAKAIRSLTEQGVKVLLIETGCYSGNTQELKMPGLCVITATPHDYIVVSTSTKMPGYFDQALVTAFGDPDLRSAEDAFLYENFNDRRNFGQISSLITPDLNFFNYFLSSFDPFSYYRDMNLTAAQGSCYDCAKDDYAFILPNQFQSMTSVSSIASGSVDLSLQDIRDNMKRALSDYIVTDSKINKAAYQLNPEPGRPTLVTGYEKYNQEELRKIYDELRAEEFLKSIPVHEQRAFFYNKFQTGEAVYQKGQKAVRRINNSCEDFKLRQ
jgi:hypothetical protein